MTRERIETARAEYHLRATASLGRWMREPVGRVVCFSDTHFVPEITAWSDDAPEDLVALLRALGEHEPWSLGDLCEWVGLREHQRRMLFASPRLAPLWALLRARRARVVVGNHDLGSVEVLRAQLGGDRVFDGGFSLGDLRVRHGHEGSRAETLAVGAIGRVAVPVYELVRRWTSRPAERLPNERVVRSVRGGARCVLFGHTHSLGASTDDPVDAWVNPGCFLRSAQSFAVLEGTEISLYQREDHRR